jgi:hypothetical protein
MPALQRPARKRPGGCQPWLTRCRRPSTPHVASGRRDRATAINAPPLHQSAGPLGGPGSDVVRQTVFVLANVSVQDPSVIGQDRVRFVAGWQLEVDPAPRGKALSICSEQ